MKRLIIAAAFALSVTTAHAQVSEQDRTLGVAKLKQAYKANGEKMCCGFYDLTGEPPIFCYEVTGVTGQKFFECPQPDDLKPTMPDAKPLKTERIMPLTDPKQKNALDAIADIINPTSASDVCKHHGLHKKESADSKSWRCRK